MSEGFSLGRPLAGTAPRRIASPGLYFLWDFKVVFFVKILTRSNPEWVRPIGSPLPPLES